MTKKNHFYFESIFSDENFNWVPDVNSSVVDIQKSGAKAAFDYLKSIDIEVDISKQKNDVFINVYLGDDDNFYMDSFNLLIKIKNNPKYTEDSKDNKKELLKMAKNFKFISEEIEKFASDMKGID